MFAIKPQQSTQARQHLDKIVDRESKRLISMLTVAHPRLVINRWPESPIEISMGMLILNDIADKGYHVSTQRTTQLENYPYRRVTISLLRPSHNDIFGGIMINNKLGVQDVILSEAIPVEIIKIPDSKILNILTQASNIKSPVGDTNQKETCKCCSTLKPQLPRELKPEPKEKRPIKKCAPAKPYVSPKPIDKTPKSEQPVNKPSQIKSDGTRKSNSVESPEMLKDAGMKLLEAIISMVEKQGMCEQKFKKIMEVLNQTI